MNLFLDKPMDLQKEAAYAARLSEQPENWPQELTSEIFRQLPFLSDYEVDVHLDRTDPSRGAAFGYADVSNKTERPELEHEQMGIPHVRIPIIVMDRSVKPFSVFLDGERVLPLTEDRVREFLFNPSSFDVSTALPRDPSLVEPLMPPQRSGIGMGGEYKMASAGVADLSLEERFVLEAQMEKQGGIPKGLRSVAESAFDTAGSLSKAQQHAASRLAAHIHGRGMGMAARDGSLMSKAYNKKLVAKEVARAKQELTSSYPTSRASQALQHGVENRRLSREVLDKKSSINKEAFSHISKPQWDALYNSFDIQKMKDQYGSTSHPAVQNKLYEMAASIYGYHPKPEPPPPSALKDYTNKKNDKAKKDSEKAQAKAQKMMTDGQALMGKKAQAGTSLLLEIAETIDENDAQSFIEKLSSSPEVVSSFNRLGIAPLLTEVFDNTKRASADERLSALADSIQPTVVTVQKLPGGDFLVKSANSNAFAPGQDAQGQVVPSQEAEEALGADTAQQMQPGQTATAVADPTVTEDQEEEESLAKVVEEFGQYKVQDMHGNSLLGHVFPKTLAWDGNFSPQPLALFTNGSSYAFQDSIAGEMVGKGTNLPTDLPRGDGVFYYVKGGEAIATAPITIGSTMTGPDGLAKFVGTDAFGNQVQISQAEGLKSPMRLSDSEYALPEDWKFMRLNNQTQLIPDPVQMNKAASVRNEMNSATLFFNGSYNLVGGCGLDKLSSDYRYELDPVSAEFMLGLLGVEGSLAKSKVAECRKKGRVKLSGLRTINLLSERYEKAEKTASAMLQKAPLIRVDLLKEAAAVDDADTVDKLLALNFINPENLTSFINYLPEIEHSSEKLAEMLLYSYIGMQEIPEESVERAMKSTEDVVRHLKAVAYAEG